MPQGVSRYGGTAYPAPPLLVVFLEYTSYSQAGNYSTWKWYLRYDQDRAQFWASNPDHRMILSGFAVGGPYYFGVPSSWSGAEIYHYVQGPAYFNKGHNARGYLTAGYLGGEGIMGPGASPYATTAYATVHSGTPPRIPKAPVAPPAPVFVSSESNSIVFTVAEPADMGGSARTSFTCQALLPGTDTVVANWSANSLTQTTPEVLDPDTTYDIRYYVSNGIGNGPWSPRTAMTTEAGFFVSDGVDWHGSRPYVSDGTDWVSADARVSTGSAWVRPEA